MNIDALIKFLAGQNCTKIYFKKLSPNDNSKNQVYLGGNFEVLNILPFSEITSDNDGDWKRTRFKTKLNFFWITEDFEITPAPEAQLILYPKYPEVRFSGFLKDTLHQTNLKLEEKSQVSRIYPNLVFLR